MKGDKNGTHCKSVPVQQAQRRCISRPGDIGSIPLISHRHSLMLMEERSALHILLLAKAMYPSET